MSEGKRSWASMQIIARIAIIAAAVALVAAFFLPWASADDEFRDAAVRFPDTMFYEPVGMTVTDACDLSLAEYAQVYGSMGDASQAWTLYMAIMYATLGASVLALVLSAAGKPVGGAVFALATLGISRLLVWDFGDRGVLPNGTHDWGIAPTIYLLGAIALIAAAVWLLVLKRQAGAQSSAEAERMAA